MAYQLHGMPAFHNHKPCDTAESILTTFNKIPVDKKYFAL
jgi:hypothetical protein